MPTDWWKGASIYQIYPRSFFDSNGDGIGDINGIAAKLDYIQSLQVDAIWISPFFSSPMKDFGYDVSDYRNVDPIFGTLNDFKKLIVECKSRKLRILIDMVVSHTSDQHPWFQCSRKDKTNSHADWYVWSEANKDGTPPNNWLSVFGGSAWQWDSTRKQYYLHNFLKSQPDLNFQNPAVRKQIKEEMVFWLELGVDGFRLDTANYYLHDNELRSNPAINICPEDTTTNGANPYDYQEHLFDKNRPDNLKILEEFRQLSDAYPETFLLGEIGDLFANKHIAAYTKKDKRLHSCYSFELLKNTCSSDYFAQSLNSLQGELGEGWPTWALSNHDCTRVASRWKQNGIDDVQQASFFLCLLLSLRGSVCLYNGEELGLTEAELTLDQLQDPWGIELWPEYKGRDGCRTPIPWKHNENYCGFSNQEPWLPIPKEHIHLSVDRQDQGGSRLDNARKLLNWRKESELLKTGECSQLESHNNVLSFQRFNNTIELEFYYNFSIESREIEIPHDSYKLIPVPAVKNARTDKSTLRMEGMSIALLERRK